MSEIPEAIAARIALLRLAAEGRAEYAKLQEGPAQAVLLAQAAALQSAADIMEGDDGPLYGLLPSWRWTDEMERALFAHPALGVRDEHDNDSSKPPQSPGADNPKHRYEIGVMLGDAPEEAGLYVWNCCCGAEGEGDSYDEAVTAGDAHLDRPEGAL
jgi:hypothetical protein